MKRVLLVQLSGSAQYDYAEEECLREVGSAAGARVKVC